MKWSRDICELVFNPVQLDTCWKTTSKMPSTISQPSVTESALKEVTPNKYEIIKAMKEKEVSGADCDHEYKTQENRNQTGMKNVTHKRNQLDSSGHSKMILRFGKNLPQSLKKFLSNFNIMAIQNSLDVFHNTLNGITVNSPTDQLADV
ncbi:hypothetical protein pdam_00000469 [Pocillopora damicornis]|uniref:Uncharacterized protein n=1 Tax=Pocillopora damicornis TaxID=46731 RepID=A0A3M6UJJ4_POCDA|nr:hypothetical protein pdam_00000469 [Pocillopora damicornis]